MLCVLPSRIQQTMLVLGTKKGFRGRAFKVGCAPSPPSFHESNEKGMEEEEEVPWRRVKRGEKCHQHSLREWPIKLVGGRREKEGTSDGKKVGWAGGKRTSGERCYIRFVRANWSTEGMARCWKRKIYSLNLGNLATFLAKSLPLRKDLFLHPPPQFPP